MQVWDTGNTGVIGNRWVGFSDWIMRARVAFSNDGTRIASGSHYGSIEVRGASTGCSVSYPFQEHRRRVSEVCLLEGETSIDSYSTNDAVKIRQIGKFFLDTQEKHMMSMGFASLALPMNPDLSLEIDMDDCMFGMQRLSN